MRSFVSLSTYMYVLIGQVHVQYMQTGAVDMFLFLVFWEYSSFLSDGLSYAS